MAGDVVGRVSLDVNGFVAGAKKAGAAAQSLLGSIQTFATRVNAVGSKVRDVFSGVSTSSSSKNIAVLQHSLALAERQVELLRKEIDRLNNQKVSVSSIKYLEKEYETAARKAAQLRAALTQEQAKPNQVNTDAYKALEARLAKLSSLKDALNKKIANTPPAKFGTLERQLEQVERMSKRVSAQMAAMRGPDDAKVNKLQEAVAKAELKAEKLKEKLDAAGNEPQNAMAILRLEKQLMAATNQAEKLRSRIAAAGGGGGIGSSAITSMNSMFGKMQGAADQAAKTVRATFSNAERGIMGFRQQLLNVNDAIRLAAQGITDFGRTLMFFVSLPLLAVFRSWTVDAINFEDAMMRVAKTADLTKDGLARVTEGIRQVALTTASTHTELARTAEVLGQLGIADPSAIVRLTKVMDVFANATAQTGEEVATAMGQIAAAFGKDLGASEEWVWELMGSINVLENQTAATAGQIQTALTEFAPLANVMKLTASEAAALAATLITMGLSADEAGTALARMSEFLVKNADKVSQAMAGYSDAYATADSVISALESDPLQVLMDIADAASRSERPLQAAAELLQILGERGGKAVLLMMQNLGLLRSNLEAVNRPLENGRRLMEEYEQAMSTTKSQLGLLRNQFTDLGITVGDAVLPVITRLVGVAAPAIKMFAAWFKGLGQTNKGLQTSIILWGLLIVVLGPALMLIGQMVHGFSLIFLGAGKLLSVFAALVGGIGRVAAVLITVGKVFLGWPGLVLAGVVGVLAILSGIGVDIAGFFSRIAQSAKTWGENLAKNLGAGLLAGAVRYVTEAISYIANLISSFFESHSPPKAGPLSTIDQWGKGLLNTFFKGFYAADFGILEDISSTIEQMLTAGLEGDALVGALRQLAKSRVKLSALISEFNQTGVINEQLLDDATQGLGDMTGKVKELVRLTLRYKALQERLSALEKKKKDILRSYDDEIAAIGQSNMSIVEKINAIRAVRRERDSGLEEIDREEELLQQQADLMKEQLEYQQGLIDSLNKQEDIFLRIADLLKQIAEEAKNASKASEGMGGGGMGDLGGGLGGGLGDVTKPFEEAVAGMKEQLDSLFNVWDGFADGRTALQGFIDAWKGLPSRVEEDLPASVVDLYNKLYELGETVRKVFDTFTELKGKASELWSEVQKFFEKDENGDIAGLTSASSAAGKAIDDLRTKMQPAIDVFSSVVLPILGFLTLVVGIPGAVLLASNGIGTLVAAVTTLGGVVATAITAVGWPLLIVAGMVAAFAAAWIGNWFGIRDFTANVVGAIGKALLPVWESIKKQFDNLKPSIDRLMQAFSELWTAVQPLGAVIAPLANIILGMLGAALTFVIGVLTGLVAGIAQFITATIAAGTQLVTGIVNIVTGIINTVIGLFQALLGIVTGDADMVNQAFSKMATGWGQLVEGAVNVILGLFNFLFTAVGGAITLFVSTTLATMEGMWNSLTGSTSNWADWFNTRVTEVLTSISELFTKTIPDWVSSGSDMIQGFFDGLAAGAAGVVNYITEFVGDIIDTFKALLGIHSPSTLFEGFGTDLIQGFINGISSMVSGVTEVINSVVTTVVDGIKSLFGGSDQGGEGFDLDSMLPSEADVQARTSAIQSSITNFTSSIASQFSTAGSSIEALWSSLWNQIESKAGNGAGVVKPFASSVTSAFQVLVKDVSGEWDRLWSSFEKGPTDAANGIKAAIERLATAMSSSMKRGETAVKSLLSVFDRLKSSIGNAEKSQTILNTRLAGMQTTKVTSMASAWTAVKTNISSAYTSLVSFISKLGALNNTSVTVKLTANGSGASMSFNNSGTQDDTTWTGNGTGTITPKASGGRVAPFNAYQVGEVGPELFIPDQGGTIVPNYMLERMLKATGRDDVEGGAAAVNIVINNPVVRDDRDIQKLAQEVARVMGKAVNQRMRFGGNTSM